MYSRGKGSQRVWQFSESRDEMCKKRGGGKKFLHRGGRNVIHVVGGAERVAVTCTRGGEKKKEV